MKKFYYILCLLVLVLDVKANKLIIEVKDHKTKESIENARISFPSNTAFIRLKNGSMLVENPTFPLQIKCSNVGYELKSISIYKNEIISRGGEDFYTVLLERSTTQINEVVVTGQVSPVIAKQSIYKVSTISATEINQRAAVSLYDVLNYEMNNFVSNDNILGNSVNIAGIGGQNVKVLINGIPLMGRENGNIDLGQLNLNNIKRVEMIQGPMSVIYGSNALGGVLNLISNVPKKAFSVNARSYLESIGRYNFSGNIGLTKRKHQLQFSIARNFFDGWTPKDSIDRFQLWKPKTQYTGDIQYWYTIGKVKFNYFASFLNEKITNKGEPIVNPYEGYAFDEYYRTHRIINSFSANVALDSVSQLSFTNSIQLYNRTKNRVKKDLVNLTQFETQNVGDQDTTSFYDLNLRGIYSTSKIKKLALQLGYEYMYEVGLSYKLAEQKQTMSEIGLFGSGLYKLNDIQIQPSLRVTYNNRYKISYTPAIHAKLDINAFTQIRASYARGFRAPTLKELYLQFIDQNHTIIGNPTLKPEVGDHVELSLEHQFNVKKSANSISINGYYNAVQNLIALAVFNNHGVLRQYANIEDYQNWVLNVRGKTSFSNFSFNIGTGIIYVEKTNITPQHSIFEHILTGSYFIKPLKTGINFNYKYNSRQPVITVDQQFLYTNPLHIANASIQRTFLNKSLQVQVGVKNLFNIQNTSLNGSLESTNNPHSNGGAMQVFPARSIFLDLNYSL